LKVYQVGIIGFGFIGKVHAYGYRNLPFFYDPVPLNARITHIVTGHGETAREAAQLVDADHSGTDYREVTENPAIDIVHICSPNHLHKDAVLSAIRHGKHIYCDKPLASTMDEAEEILEALAGYRGTSQMTFQNRFFPATMRAKQLVDAGSLGDLLAFRAAYLHSGSADPNAPLKWKLSAAAGGGVIADLAPHMLDLIEWLAGPFRSVMAATHIAYPQRPSFGDAGVPMPVDAEDSVTLLARLQCGALGTIEATKLATGMEDEMRLEIHGSRGALRFNLMDPHHLEFYDATALSEPQGGLRGWNRIDAGQRYAKPATSFPTPKAATGWLRGHVACLANFLASVAAGRPAQPDLTQGVRVQRLMDCIRRSASDRSWIDAC
jgi:predicted dehydrogenase